jgi:inner membrane protein
MDTITHGLAGALIAKAFFAESAPATILPAGLQHLGSPEANTCSAAEQAGRVAVWAATLGSVFPDADIVFELFDSKDLALIELHRGFTHSFLCLPFLATGLAALTRWLARRWQIASPSRGVLVLIYASALLSHIVLDLITSFGTMIWSPLVNTRVAWDLAFIIDFTMTGIVLLPQIAAWAYRREAGGARAPEASATTSATACGRILRARRPFPRESH